ncbi:hypothetical protein LOD99_6274 [Oopsacas minuta]|uniref:TTF-type domain-containing protein n=1 Tax=Oopsacas minuta TaxID=111878 RepID=A0AAV7JNG9_9METZ|nr:hypothetical protein LOD99_6274 [Oopsacas minuta]
MWIRKCFAITISKLNFFFRRAVLSESLSVPSGCNMLCETVSLNFNYLQEESFSGDVGKWRMSDDLREYFCQKGFTGCQHMDSDFSPSERTFPSETFTRRCTKSLFYHDQLNGEKFQRDWLWYSVESGKLYCSICMLFSTPDEASQLATNGYSDWKHGDSDLLRHEGSQLHKISIEKLILRRMTGGHIDESLIEQYESEKKYWHQVFQRILHVIKMLSSKGLSFRGSDQIVGFVHNVSDQIRDKANDLINIYSDDLEPGFVDEIVQFSAFWDSYISSDSSKIEDTKQIREFQMFKLIKRNALDTTIPNMLITLRIYLSLMDTNCGGKRSFQH